MTTNIIDMDNSAPYSQPISHPLQGQHTSQQPMPPQPYGMQPSRAPPSAHSGGTASIQSGGAPSVSSGRTTSTQPGASEGIKTEYDGSSTSSYQGGPPPASQNGQPYPYHPRAQSGVPPSDATEPRPGGPPTVGGGMPITNQVTTVTHEPVSHSMIEFGRRYRLDVIQQPKRARMCGFGDKDRRPITPPPCIRLVITDAKSGNEIDVNDIDYGLFVLNVDLWSADGLREVSLVRHSAAAPGSNLALNGVTPVSFATPASVYPNPLPVPTGHPNIVRDPQFPYHLNQPGQPVDPGPLPYNPYPHQPQVNPYSHHNQPSQHGHHSLGPGPSASSTSPSTDRSQYGGSSSPQGQRHYGQLPTSQMAPPLPQMPMVTLPQHQQMQTAEYPLRVGSPVYNPPSRFPDPPNHHVFYHTGSSVHAIASNTMRPMYNEQPPVDMRVHNAQPQATGMFTRNLIGSLAASAFKLTDPQDKMGIWFVLQDLSVRTEGNFRLRFAFVNVGAPGKTPNGNPSNPLSIVNRDKAPILASCYSDIFTVYSAKKFPGVVESTPLSKCFATQGIKIPIRKEGPTKDRGEYDSD